MTVGTDVIDRAWPARRPAGRLAGYHCWHNLLFLHWRVAPELIAPLLPRGLELDTWDDNAWVGLVPFSISGLRPWWFPPLPGVSAFHEINVRTYVHRHGRDPGVWFFSLDATCEAAVRVARWQWHLNYVKTRMQLGRAGNAIEYNCRRPGRKTGGAHIVAEIGSPLGHDEHDRELPAGRTLPGTLAHFLLDRYILYAQRENRPLYRAQVHHVPYGVQEARLIECQESLLAANGIVVDEPPCHAAFCRRAEVEVFPLRRV